MFSHECAGIAQAGGLAEAVAGLAGTLSLDSGLNVTVLLPSHGKHSDPEIRESYHLTEEPTFTAQGYRVGVNGVRYAFLSGIEKGHRDNVDYVLVKGLDDQTSHWLDDPVLYDHDLTFEKMSLFARTVKLYSEYLMSMRRRSELPDLIHAHDWHMVPAGVAVKQHFEQRGLSVPLVYTVHLLSQVMLPWHFASDEWCGIQDLPQRIRVGKRQAQSLNYRQVWEGLCQNSIERFGCYEADYVTSVSEKYLANDVLGYVGDAIRGKCGHIYNGCDWDLGSIQRAAFADIGVHEKGVEQTRPNRWDLRKYLLTRGITEVNTGTSTQSVESSGQARPRDIVEPFQSDGPLVLMTGRLSPQKGADLLLDAVPAVTEAIPTAKFLLFLIPSNDTNQMTAVEKTAAAYPNNVRIVFAKHRPTYMMSHLAADVYAMPSRFEPFGISALEAMVTGSPIVGSSIGGITETVLDIASHGRSGTGILFPVEDTVAFAAALISLLLVMQIDEQAMRGGENLRVLADRVPIKPIAAMVSENPTLGSQFRENCKSRVEQNFRWRNAGKMAIERYAAAMSLSASRARRELRAGR